MIAHALTILASLLALAWLWQAIAATRGVPTLPDLTREADNKTCEAPLDDPIPDLTVLVPACNEEGSVQNTLRSLLASTGLRLQIIAIDDRSTDATGALMDAVAAEPKPVNCRHDLEVIHLRELPPGWLGKTHALALGAERARAPWLLFTDADVRFNPGALASAVRYAHTESADHVVLLLTLDFESPAEAAVFATFQALSAWNCRLWKAADPKAWDFFGAGGFNMVRRDVYERLGGFAALRMEVVEDLRLGWKVKRAGYAQRVVLGPGLVRIRWIKGALGIVGLLEKNGFASLRYKTALALLACTGFAVQILLPLVALASGGWAAIAGLAALASVGLTFAANRRITQVSPWHFVLFLPATCILMFALLRSVVLTLKRGGVVWRGTLYPLDDLRRDAGRW